MSDKICPKCNCWQTTSKVINPRCECKSELAPVTGDVVQRAIAAYHLLEKAKELLDPTQPIALPIEYQCVVCGEKTRRTENMSSLGWIEEVAGWCAHHRQKHSPNTKPTRSSREGRG